MLLWVGFAVLTAGVVAALLRPLARENDEPLAAREADLAVYRDQLAEIEADRERGLIAPREAEAARIEVARRVIEIGDAEERSRSSMSLAQGAHLTPVVRRAIAVAIPAFAVAIYLGLGSPGLPGQPFVDPGSKPLEQASRAELVAIIEGKLRERPDDGKGWDVIAPAYLSQQRFAEAADAYGRAIKLLGESVQRLKGLAESSILANNGLVTEAARKSFERILVLQPENGEARFGLALAMEQDGRLREAADEYKKILDAAPADARWKPALEVRLGRLLRGQLLGPLLPCCYHGI